MLIKMAKIESSWAGKSGDDVHFGNATGGGDGAAAKAGQVVAISAGDPLDQAKPADAIELSGESSRARIWNEGNQVCPAHAPDVELRSLQGAEQRLFAALEEVQALDEAIFVTPIFAQPIEGADAGAVVVESGQVLQISPAAAQQDLAQIDQAVDRLLDRRQLAAAGTLAMFHLAMVLEEGDVVDRRLDTQNQMVLVVHLHLGFAEARLDAGSLDAGLKARADLLGELRRDLLAQETGDMLGLDRQHRLAGKLFMQGLERLGGAKDKIEGILHLHQAPVVALVEGFQDRAAQLSVTVGAPDATAWARAHPQTPGPAPSHRSAQRHCRQG